MQFRNFIPSGNCVPDLGAEPSESVSAFERLDAGQSPDIESDVEVARLACKNCLQLPHCTSQREAIATEIWRHGSGLVVVGAEAVAATLQPRDPVELLVEPKLKFNLKELRRVEPGQKLEFIRQGVRAGQLAFDGRDSEGVATITTNLLDHAKNADPDMMQKAEETLLPQDIWRAARYMTFTLCQTADFENYAAKKRPARYPEARNRYNPRHFDMEANYPVVKKFLQEVIAIREQGFHWPATKAINHSADFYRRLALAEKDNSITWAVFDVIVHDYVRDPVAGVRKYKARLVREQHKKERVAEAFARRNARQNSSGQQKTVPTAGMPDYITPALINNLKASYSDPQQAAEDLVERVEYAKRQYGEDHPRIRVKDMVSFARNYPLGYEQALAQYDQNLQNLEAKYPKHPDMTPSTLRHLAGIHLKNALPEAAAYLERLAALRRESDGTVTDASLRDSAMRGIDSFAAARHHHIRKRLIQRYGAKSRANPESVRMETWILDKVYGVYPADQVEEVCDTIYDFLNKGLLCKVAAEMDQLTEPAARELLGRIADPRTRQYLAFPLALQPLPVEGRLMLAYTYNLAPLLYGHEISGLQLETLFGFLAQGEEMEKAVKRKAAKLIAVSPPEEKENPLPIMQNVADLGKLKLRRKPAFAPPIPWGQMVTITQATTVVGAELLWMGAVEAPAEGLSQKQQAWLKKEVAYFYPPAERAEAAETLARAIQSGMFALQERDDGEFVLLFGKQLRDAGISDVERAALAHIAGADRLIYGTNLALILAERLKTNSLQIYVQRSVLPKICTVEPAVEAMPQTQLPSPESVAWVPESVLTPQSPPQVEPEPAEEYASFEEDDQEDADPFDQDVSELPVDLLRVYAQRAKKIPLLAPEEEVALAKQIEAGEYARTLLDEIAESGTYDTVPASTWQFYDSLTEEEAQAALKEDLAQLVEEGKESKNRFIEANLLLSMKFAYPFMRQRHDLVIDELVQEGNLGLIHAIEKFDYKKGIKFSTYAAWWLRQRIRRTIEGTGRTVRLPTHVHQKLRQIDGTVKSLREKLGRQPTDEEVAKETGIKLSYFKELQGADGRILSLNVKLLDGEDTELGDVIDDQDAHEVFENIEDGAVAQQLRDLVNALPEREAAVMNLLYGLQSGEPLRQVEVAERLGLSRVSVRAIQTRALRRLAKHAEVFADSF